MRSLAASTGWLALEALIAISTAYSLGLVATFRTTRKMDKWLDLSVSRGLEFVAALPIVLTAAVLVVLSRLPVPSAVALVVGTLRGLRFAHVILSMSARVSGDINARESARQRRDFSSRLAILAVPSTVEQIIGLEAALAWLDLLGSPWTGGWGQCLGRAARASNLREIAVWTCATVALSVGLKLITWTGRDGEDDGPNGQVLPSVPPSV